MDILQELWNRNVQPRKDKAVTYDDKNGAYRHRILTSPGKANLQKEYKTARNDKVCCTL